VVEVSRRTVQYEKFEAVLDVKGSAQRVPRGKHAAIRVLTLNSVVCRSLGFNDESELINNQESSRNNPCLYSPCTIILTHRKIREIVNEKPRSISSVSLVVVRMVFPIERDSMLSIVGLPKHLRIVCIHLGSGLCRGRMHAHNSIQVFSKEIIS